MPRHLELLVAEAALEGLAAAHLLEVLQGLHVGHLLAAVLALARALADVGLL